MAKTIVRRAPPATSFDPHARSPFVGIAGAIGGTLIVMIAVIGLFVQENEAAAIGIVAISMAVLGIFLGLFALKKC